MSDYDLKKMTNKEINEHNELVARRQLERAEKLLLGGIKHDSGTDKPSMGLLPMGPLQDVAKVLDYGAKKYSKHNWRKGFEYSRLYDAILRHVAAFVDGEDNDPETGFSHIAHAACSCLFLLEHLQKGLGKDDRYKE